MTGFAYRVQVRDPAMAEVAVTGPYSDLDVDLRLMAIDGDAGVIKVVLSNRDPARDALLVEGAGIVLRHPTTGAVIASGDIVDIDDDAEAGGALTVTAEPDDSIALDELAFPNPTVDVPTTGTATSAAYDVRTGPAETAAIAYVAANIGPAAGIVRRRYPWVLIPTSAGRGTSGTWKARDDVLADLLTRVLVPAGLAWRFTQHDTIKAKVALTIWEPGQPSLAPFGALSGTVTGVRVTLTPRSVDEVIVAAAGQLDARVRTRRSVNPAPGRRRRVTWIDQRQTADLTEMRQAADEALTEGAITGAATFTLHEVPGGPSYGTDFRLGDRVTVASRTASVTEVIRSVRITQGEGDARPVITPRIGHPDTGAISSLAVVRRLLTPLLRS